MQVVILCGGMGTRIRDVAEDIPKPMIPIGPRPILWHLMGCYARHGFKRFVVCLGHKGWLIKRWFLDYHLAEADFTLRLDAPEHLDIRKLSHPEDWEITFVETGLHAMTGARVRKAAPYIDGEQFLLTYGDGLSDVDIGELVEFHRRHGRLGTVTTVPQPGRFGEVEIDGTRVVAFAEKPARTLGRISGGFFVFQRSFLDRLADDDDDLVLEQAPLLELVRDGELAAYLHEGFWHCMDNSRDYHYLNQLWNDGKVPWVRTPKALRAAA
jgi:glucose-1-phosphate cytidylyltransferase